MHFLWMLFKRMKSAKHIRFAVILIQCIAAIRHYFRPQDAYLCRNYFWTVFSHSLSSPTFSPPISLLRTQLPVCMFVCGIVFSREVHKSIVWCRNLHTEVYMKLTSHMSGARNLFTLNCNRTENSSRQLFSISQLTLTYNDRKNSGIHYSHAVLRFQR